MLLWIILLIVIPTLVFILLFLNLLFSSKISYNEKISSYECGFTPLRHQTRKPFNIHYFLVAILFLIFDLEIAIFYPFAVSMRQFSYYGYWIAIIFLSLLTIGFLFEFGKGALNLNKRNTIERVL